MEHGIPYIKGRLKGLFKRKNSRHTGKIVFSDIEWIYMRIDDCSKLNSFDVKTQKTGDFWYKERIHSTKVFNPFRKKTEIFIPHGTDEAFTGTLHDVLIKNIQISEETSYFLGKDWQEATGDIYFRVNSHQPVVPKQISDKRIIQSIESVPAKKVEESSKSAIHQQTNAVVTDHDSNQNSNQSNNQSIVDNVTSKIENGSRKVGEWISMLIGLIIIAMICYYLWQYKRVLSYILLGIFGLWLISSFINLGRIIKNIFSLLFFGFLAYLIFNFFYKSASKRAPVKKKTGEIKINPEKEDGNDFKSEKEINWYDFQDQYFQAKYSTSKKQFDHSVDEQSALNAEFTQKSSSSLEYYSKLYDGLYRMDKSKIKLVANIFRDSAQKLKLSPLQTAEMVVTFIQEIPYYLVHDGSCSDATRSGNDFMIEYHNEHKPCLANVKGGVQSPYEFVHNLKGDCDTRSLLGFTILKELNIASSVWVSETYGHSILGVAVPAGTGMFKTIDGIKHYGVELTAKGFRVGMVAPDQAYPENWNTTVFYNH